MADGGWNRAGTGELLTPMEHSLSIAGLSDLVGLVSVVVSIVAVGVMLQRMKGPGNREPQA